MSTPPPPLQVSCSIKLVSQKDGTDLDPHSLKYRPRAEGAGLHVSAAMAVLYRNLVWPRDAAWAGVWEHIEHVCVGLGMAAWRRVFSSPGCG